MRFVVYAEGKFLYPSTPDVSPLDRHWKGRTVPNNNDVLQKVADGVYYLSTLEAGTAPVSGSYVIRGEKVYLVETGTTEVASLMLRSLGHLGIDRAEVAGIIATHVHLDHSGGAGGLVRQMPWLKVYVHRSGAKHLTDPSRLLAGADKVYGGREAVLKMHGLVHPVPRENVVPVEHAAIEAGAGVTLRIFPGPGHAPHHLIICEEAQRLAFVGELPGHYVPRYEALYPALAPPGFHYPDTLRSLEKLEALAPRMLCFSQFGFTERVADTIALAREQISHMHLTLSRLHQKEASDDEMVSALLMDPMYEAVSRLPHREPAEGLFMSAVKAFREYYRRNK